MKERQAKLPRQNAIEQEDITLLQWEEYNATQVEVDSMLVELKTYISQQL
jgi:hypothetical protein